MTSDPEENTNMPDFMKIDSARLERASTEKEEPAAQRPDAESVKRFHDSMESDQDPAGQSGHAPGDAADEAPGQMPSLPLDALFSGRMVSPAPPEVRPDGPMPSGELVESLVERILVGQNADGGQEVRLRLGSDTLPGTEIRLTKNADGTLQVVLATDNASSFQTLVAAQHDLKARLERLDCPVRVDVTSESGSEDNDSRRRSRGLVPETDEPR
jgi:type III secretion system needle length determinant